MWLPAIHFAQNLLSPLDQLHLGFGQNSKLLLHQNPELTACFPWIISFSVVTDSAASVAHRFSGFREVVAHRHAAQVQVPC